MFRYRVVVIFILIVFLTSGCINRGADMFKDKNDTSGTKSSFSNSTLNKKKKPVRPGVVDLSEDSPITNMEKDSVNFDFENLQ